MDAENANLVEAGFASSPQLPQTQLIDKGEGSSQLPGMTHSAFVVWFTRQPPACRNRKALIVLNCFPECLFQQQQKETLLFGFQPSWPLGTYSA
jgi:hypothetical protein